MKALATILIGLVGSQVPMDQSWLARQGPGPYLLTQAGATYVLQADVTTPGTAFLVMAPNVTLNLNGHTVTYGNSQPIAVANGGFEQGSGPADIPGWDVTRAPGAVRLPARTGMWGHWMLELPSVNAAQTVVSSPVNIPDPNVEYAAAITPKCNVFGSTMSLSVIDAATGAVIASAPSRNPNRGFSPVVQFTPTTTAPVRLQVTVAPPSGTTVAVDLDYAAVYRSRRYGVVATSSHYYLPADLQLSVVKAKASAVASFTLEGGTIRQGTGNTYAGSALYARGTVGVTVDRIVAYAGGMDNDIFDLTSTSNDVISNCTIHADVDRVGNRMRICSAIKLMNVAGSATVRQNTISGPTQSGIIVNNLATATGTLTLIEGNTISQHSLVTDGYGIVIDNLKNFEIARNTVQPVEGRGLILDGFNSSTTRDGTIHDNLFCAREHGNLEYPPTSMEATAFRMRNDRSSTFKNITFYNNTFSATTGPGSDWAAIGARLSLRSFDTKIMANANIVFHHNTFEAILTGVDPAYQNANIPKAWALTLAGVSPGTDTRFLGNTFVSNSVPLNFGENDSWQDSISDVTFLGNTIRKSGDGVEGVYQGIVAGDWRNTVTNIRLIDMRYASGATSNVTFLGPKPKDLDFGWLLNVTVADRAGKPVAGATVQVQNQDGLHVYTGTTDAQGKITGIALVTTTLTAVPGKSDPNGQVVTVKKNFTITGLFDGRRASASIDLSGDSDVAVQLP